VQQAGTPGGKGAGVVGQAADPADLRPLPVLGRQHQASAEIAAGPGPALSPAPALGLGGIAVLGGALAAAAAKVLKDQVADAKVGKPDPDPEGGTN
jgi:hypothetical protein